MQPFKLNHRTRSGWWISWWNASLYPLSYVNINTCVAIWRNETEQSNELNGKNWIALERAIETSLVSTQTLISCGWPADRINIQLLFESHRYEIWTWVRALQLDQETLTTPLFLCQAHTHQYHIRDLTTLFNSVPETGQTSKALWILCLLFFSPTNEYFMMRSYSVIDFKWSITSTFKEKNNV